MCVYFWRTGNESTGNYRCWSRETGIGFVYPNTTLNQLIRVRVEDVRDGASEEQGLLLLIADRCSRVSAFGFVQTQNEREWMDVGQNIQSKKMMRYYWKVIVWPRQASSTRNTRNWAWLRGSVDSVHYGVHHHRDLDVPYIFGDCGMLSVRLLITTVVRWYSAHWNLWSGRSRMT